VTVSIGIAESRPNATVEQIIEQADKALYSAKQGGRNRIELGGVEKKRRKQLKASEPSQS
jgi:predicted signal transduction protein with EAL and GGDEF domain